jgi:hypothetical protein
MTHPTPSECQEGHLSGLHATRPRQHLSGIHPPGGRVAPSAPVVWPMPKPGGICLPPTELQQRWAAAVATVRDDRMPAETDMVAGTFGPPEDVRQQTPQ